MSLFETRQELTFAGWLGTIETREGRVLPAEQIGLLYEAWFAAIRNIELDVIDFKQLLGQAVNEIVDERIAAYRETQAMP